MTSIRVPVRWEGEVDVCNGSFGEAFEDGAWDVLARVPFLASPASTLAS